MVRVLGTIFAGLIGLAFGSFLNVCLSRWPRGMSVVKPRSYCESCGRTLAWWENVPLVSWLALRGRCRTCRAWIGWRTLLVELTVGGTWSLLWWRFFSRFATVDSAIATGDGPNLTQALLLMALDFVLVWLAALDAEHLWIPDIVTLPGIVLGLALPALVDGTLGGTLVLHQAPWRRIGERVLGAAVGAALILTIRWIYWLIRRREGIGLGDAKLMAMLGAWLGLSGALLSFALGVVLGSLVALIVLATRKKRDDTGGWAGEKLPLGTFLCIGGIISGLWGERIIAAYLRWAGF